jgi:hypothetical protein
MNIPKLTNKELDSIYAIKFNNDDSLTEAENDLQQTETAKKIMAILIFNTDIVYPEQLLDEIQKTADRINAEELRLKVIDNDNPENNTETVLRSLDPPEE